MNLFDTVVVQPIFNLLVLIYSVVPFADFGIALIIVTIIIRFLMWPLVKKQLHQTKAMRKIQPELARIKKKSKGNKQLEGMQMLELYKKHNINPFRSIGILLIQLPIFIALYRVIQVFTLHRDEIAKWTYDFLEGIPRIAAIIEDPSQFNEKLLGFIDLTQHAISQEGISIVLIILALIASFTQYTVSKQISPQTGETKRFRDILADAGEGKEPDQAEMNAAMMGKMMKFMPIMMFFIMINLPGALALYFTISNLLAAAQQHYILNQDKKEMDDIASESTGISKSTKKAKKSAPKKATIVKDTPTKKSRDKMKSETTVTRIVAKDTRERSK